MRKSYSGREIYISNKLAFNSNDRIINVISQKQKDAIKYRYSVLKEYNSLTEMLDEKKLLSFYNTELQINNISKDVDLRKLFIQSQISKYKATGMSEKLYVREIMAETGFKTVTQLIKVAYS